MNAMEISVDLLNLNIFIPASVNALDYLIFPTYRMNGNKLRACFNFT